MLRCQALVSARYRAKARAPKPSQLFRGRPYAALAANAFEQAHSAIVVDDVLESCIDRLRESLRAKDLFHSFDFRAVDGQTSLVFFGYLLGHAADILGGEDGSVQWRF